MKRTMVGMAPNMSEPPKGAAPANPLKGTMIGMPAMGAAAAGTPQRAGSPPGSPAPSEPAHAQSAPLGVKQTMIGMAAPMANAPAAASPSVNRAGTDHKKTMLGVAMPGIAPLAPGV